MSYTGWRLFQEISRVVSTPDEPSRIYRKRPRHVLQFFDAYADRSHHTWNTNWWFSIHISIQKVKRTEKRIKNEKFNYISGEGGGVCSPLPTQTPPSKVSARLSRGSDSTPRDSQKGIGQPVRQAIHPSPLSARGPLARTQARGVLCPTLSRQDPYKSRRSRKHVIRVIGDSVCMWEAFLTGGQTQSARVLWGPDWFVYLDNIQTIVYFSPVNTCSTSTIPFPTQQSILR